MELLSDVIHIFLNKSANAHTIYPLEPFLLSSTSISFNRSFSMKYLLSS